MAQNRAVIYAKTATGLNLGPFLFTLSGTIGATYTAVERGIPAIAFSGAYSVSSPYFLVNETTAAGLEDPATITAKLAANLVQTLVEKAKGSRILPLGYGINVNIPLITSYKDDSCVDPPFIHSRLTGGAVVDSAVYNETTGLFSYGDLVAEGTNQCINGDCSLPGETDVVESCQSSVSVFTVDYDAPNCAGSKDIRDMLSPLVQVANSSELVGGLNGTTTGNSTANATVTTGSPSATAPPVTNGVARILGNGAMAAMVVVVGMFIAL